MRITNSMMINQYSRQLNTTLSNLNLANEKVITGRKFQTASQDPTSAVKAYQLRREYANNEMHTKNISNAKGILNAQEDGLMEVHKILDDLSNDVLQGVNGTMSDDDRKIIAAKLKELQKSMVATLNTAFADNNVFGGSAKKEAPFAIKDDKLFYRGIDVNTKDPDELEKLKAMSNEKILIDVGFGLSTNDDGTIDEQSGFNIALPGISFMGFGTKEVDGVEVPNNIFTLIGEMADKLESPDFDINEFEPYLKQLNNKKADVLIEVTTLGSKSSFLEHTSLRLENTKLNLNEKMVDVETIAPETAIMEFQMYEYTYRAALSMGTKILQPSFIDFMS